MAEEKPLELRVVSPSKEVINPEQGLSDERSSRQGVRCDLQENLVDSEPDVLQKSDKLYGEPELLKIVQEETYDKIHGRITAKNLMTISQNPLSLAIKVAKKLHQRANRKEPDKYDFINLASRVEEFTLRFLDPLNYDKKNREKFFNNLETKDLVDTAIKFKQKKFFDHPVIIDFLRDQWCGGYRYWRLSKGHWFFLLVCCLLDVFLFPLIFLVTFVVGKHTEYNTILKIPCLIFVRDTISYLVLLALHLAVCVESSQLSFSGLEWAILVSSAGRFFTETKQIIDLVKKTSEPGITGCSRFKAYLRDLWNAFDCLILVVYFFTILPLRVATWMQSESVNNNWILAVAGYLYGLNTIFVTLRAFGSILEIAKSVGTVQIAFFQIIGDAVVAVVHFIAITLAFASAITKVFVAEKTMVNEDNPGKQPACNKSGIKCWWNIFRHLGWSLLDLSEGLSPLESTDTYSASLAQLLFAVYLVFGLILLINLLIALLSNTYQRVQDNSRNEWVFKRAIATQTYGNYHPVPVPWNIFSIPAVWIYNFCKREMDSKERKQTDSQERGELTFLLDKYKLKYGDFFPPGNKIDRILDDAENTESMVNQILYRTFTYQKCHDKGFLPTGAEAWEAHEDILVDGYLITSQPRPQNSGWCGARYKNPFSRRFPHFEVMILESGETRWLGIGVVSGDFGTLLMPGFKKGTVGYHTDDRIIYNYDEDFIGRKSKGPTAARRGDVVRCTVMFEGELESDGQIQVPVVFSVNGSQIIPTDEKPSYVEYCTDRPLFPYLAFEYQNSVLAKMCAREDIDYQGQELKSSIAKVESKLECVQRKLDALLEKLGEGERNK